MNIQNTDNDFSGVFIEVVLINPEKTKFLYNQFNTLLVLILSKIKYDKKSSYVSVKEAMREYRSLLTKSKDDILSNEQIIGLLGELYFAEKIVEINEDAFDNWHGPECLRHDFRRNNVSIEIKSQKLREEDTPTINGLLQLVPPEDAELFFIHCVFEQNDQGVSIPDMKERLEKLGVSSEDLERKLNDAGVDYTHLDRYRHPTKKFRLERLEYYFVDEGFPKITPSSFIDPSIQDWITDVRYKINLAMARPLEEKLSNEMLENFVSDKTKFAI